MSWTPVAPGVSVGPLTVQHGRHNASLQRCLNQAVDESDRHSIVGQLVALDLDPKLRDREETEAAFGLPVITEVPLMGRRDVRKGVLHAKDRPRSFVSESRISATKAP